jgi:hypothetical protein
VKQREWRKHRVDTIEAVPAIAAPGVYTVGYFLPPRPGRGSHRRTEEAEEVKEAEEGEEGRADRGPRAVEGLPFLSDDESRSIRRVRWIPGRVESVQTVCAKANSLLPSVAALFGTHGAVERLAFQSTRSFLPKGKPFRFTIRRRDFSGLD